MLKIDTKTEILGLHKELGLNSESVEYLNFHGLRYQYLFDLITKYSNKLDYLPNVLIVGLGYEVSLLRKILPDKNIYTLGFAFDPVLKNTKIKHTEIDLNYLDKDSEKKVSKLPQFDIIIFAEVVEHLFTPPENALLFLRDMLKNTGILILQTPNAATISKRLKLLLGINPFERLRSNLKNPGHFREYTISELERMADETGFEILENHAENYFHSRNSMEKIINKLLGYVPASLRRGITMVWQKSN